jgi:uncharacterized protein YfaS (alpha-2-macroglobulin family)
MRLFKIFILCFLVTFIATAQKQNYPKQWEKVMAFEDKGLIKSANETVENIYHKAKKSHNEPQIIKCFFFKAKYMQTLEEEAQSRIIQLLQAEIEAASVPSKALLNLVYAKCLQSYLEKNYWSKINQRTNTDSSDNTSFLTWTKQDFETNIEAIYEKTLEDEDALKQTSLAKYETIFDYPSKKYLDNESLLNYVWKENLAFWSSKVDYNERYEIENFQAQLSSQSKDFLSINIKTFKKNSSKVLEFQQKIEKQNPSTENQFTRMKFWNEFYNKYDSLNQTYLNALNRLQKETKNESLIQKILVEKGTAFKNSASKETNPSFNQKAIAHLDSALAINITSEALNQALKVKHEITLKKVELKFQQEIYPNENARALVNFKNVEKLKLSFFKVEMAFLKKWLEALQDKETIDNTKISSVVFSGKAEISQEYSLPSKTDYFEYSTEIILPNLSLGTYFITYNDNIDSTNILNRLITVTNFSVLEEIESIEDNNYTKRYYVLNRKTGEPIKQVQIDADNFYLETDKVGFASYTSKKHQDINPSIIALEKDNDFLLIRNQGYSSQFESYKIHDKVEAKVEFYIARAIYRPGQTVHYKGIAIQKKNNKTSLIPQLRLEIELEDANNKTIGTSTVTCNELGAFSGEFKLPENGLTGEFTISANEPNDVKDALYDTKEDEHPIWDKTDLDDSEISFNVEEYKRPKFEVSFLPNIETYTFGQKITINGKATALAGSSVANAQVVYTIHANFEFLRTDTLTTDTFGNFTITFEAENENNYLEVIYAIDATVTDLNGETHKTNTSIKAGKKSLKLDVIIPSIIKTKNRNALTLESTNLNGKFKPTPGEVRLYYNKGISDKFKKRTFEQPEIQSISKQDFERLFPFEEYEEIKNKDSLVYTLKVDTGKESEMSLDFLKGFSSGDYYAKFIAKDSLGNKIESQSEYFTLKQSNEKLNFEGLFALEQINNNPKKDGFVEVKLTARLPNLYVLATGNHGNGVLWQEQKTILNQENVFKIPLEKSIEKAINIGVECVFDGQYFSKDLSINLEEKTYKMDLEVEVMRDKIQPNSLEKWSFQLKQDDPFLTAELLASMYDASLDNFTTKKWEGLNFRDYYGRHAYAHFKSKLTFDTQNMALKYQKTPIKKHQIAPEKNELIWFGFNFNRSGFVSYKKQIINKHSNLKSMVWGIVTDENNEPLPGVNINIKGTTRGVSTDADGFYSLNAAMGETLIFSYIGFESKEVKITTQNIDTTLEGINSALEEVVVVSEMSIEKETLSASVAQIKILSPEVVKDEELYSVIEIPQIKTRTNFAETAFFYPHIKIDENGKFSFEFTAPETLTRWKLRLMAHNSAAQTAYLEKAIVTQKELMVMPNFPRFFREKDKIVLHTTIANLSKETQNGTAYLQLFDAKNMKSIDAICSNKNINKNFSTQPNGSTDVSWEITIPEGLEGLQYKIIAKAGNFTDGEENIVPVLTNNMLVTESLPIWAKGHTKKEYVFENLKNNTSSTLQNHLLTLQYTSNPTWSVLQSLPYLMEFEHECAEQTFSRFYSNALAGDIINTNPKIAAVFENWRKNGALNATLEKNETLKSILLNETPWVLDAKSEAEKKQRVALLFDLEKLQNSQNVALTKLEGKQKSSGAFAWFDGGNDSYFITQHILAGLGHLKALKAGNASEERVNKIIQKAIPFLDDSNNQFLAQKRKSRYGSQQDFHYLYTRSFYLKTYPLETALKDSINKVLNHYQNNWQQFSLYEKGMLSLIYQRFGRHETAKNIIAHLKETASRNADWGMYWIANKSGWYWYQAPIETQALLIEAFSEVTNDTKSVEEMKVWLLKNKQIKSWASTKATTEAVYALLMTGKDWLNTKDNAIIKVGNEKIKLNTQEKEAETGYIKIDWKKNEITQKMATLSIENKSDVPSFGGYYWQYFEDLDKIKGNSGSSLAVSKELYLHSMENGKAILKRITSENPIKVGDAVTVRLIITAKEAVDYIHLKDMRASCFEPTNVLSHYEWKDRLSYYMSTKDVATHFFFDKIPQGTFVLEYSMRATNTGNFSNGITTIQSMYAPEFTSHSKGIRVNVGK